MEQHPVPQPITSYEFRLVGDMTLKQFTKLASGVVLALIVYGVNPPSFIKWFLIILFVGTGAAMAFVPFEGRPIDTWIIAFFKRIYSPTQYTWRQKQKNAAAETLPSQPEIQAPVLPPAAPVPPPKTFVLPPLPQIPESKKVEAKFTPEIVIPATPSLPNLIVGYLRNKEGKLIAGAILEIRDATGIPVRAFKTNKLGQFLTATPLSNGEYEIETEKEGFEFDIIKIRLTGQILPPVEIVSKN